MAAKIPNLIPKQNFELIRDRIGLILFEELANQVALGNLEAAASIFIDRFVPVGAEETPVINVSFERVNFDEKTSIQTKGGNIFYVDAYTKGKTTGTDRGDTLSSAQCARLLGICRAILENPIYRTLGFQPPSLSRVSVQDIQMALPENNRDANNSKMGRLTLDVQCIENVQLLPASFITEHFTSIKLDLTEKGYKYVYAYEQETINLMESIQIPNNNSPSMYSGLTNNNLWDIVNTRFLSYKANGLMEVLKVEYWMLGNNSEQHSVNALDPSQFRLIWEGDWTYSELGPLPVTEADADTGFIPAEHLENDNNGLTAVCGLDAEVTIFGASGTSDDGQNEEAMYLRMMNIPGSQFLISVMNMSNTFITPPEIIKGIYSIVKQSQTISKIIKDGNILSTWNSGGNPPNNSLKINSINTQVGHGNQRFQGFSAHSGLSDEMVSIHQTIINQFEASLGRKTW